MIDIKQVRENPEYIKEMLNRRYKEHDLEKLFENDKLWRIALKELGKLRHEKNIAADKISKLKNNEKNKKIDELKQLTGNIERLTKEVKIYQEKNIDLLLNIQNLPIENVPIGKDERDNVVVRVYGVKRKFDFVPKSHIELCESLDIIDFERGRKLSGEGFYILKSKGAELERALINFMIDVHKRQGYTEIFPPLLGKKEIFIGTGNLPKFEDDLYLTERDKLYLIPTAEVPLVSMHRNECFNIEELPKCYVSYTPCFRREAGKHADTKGIIRVHQFNKVELVKICTPETAKIEFEKLVRDAEEILQLLEIPYRVVELCTGDLSFSSAKTYDIEAWLPSKETYIEVSSCSICTDFQARRAKIKYREKPHLESKYVYTMNGSGIAVGRTMAAFVENYQEKDNSIKIPDVLKEYIKIEKINK